MNVSWDPETETVLVFGLSNGGWFLFSRESLAGGKAHAIADQVRYSPVVTGAPPMDWAEHQQAFATATEVFLNPSKCEIARHRPEHRITVAVAIYLAAEDRVRNWGGFQGEKEGLPAMYADLSAAERDLVDARHRGEDISATFKSTADLEGDESCRQCAPRPST